MNSSKLEHQLKELTIDPSKMTEPVSKTAHVPSQQITTVAIKTTKNNVDSVKFESADSAIETDEGLNSENDSFDKETSSGNGISTWFIDYFKEMNKHFIF